MRRLRGLRAFGLTCRVTAALLAPDDVVPTVTLRTGHRLPGADFYGWALLYELPADRGIGWVDRHDEIDELPAFYESPLELLDRATYLAARGVATRPLAVVAQAEDFVADGTCGRRNRFFPDAVCRQRGGCRWLE